MASRSNLFLGIAPSNRRLAVVAMMDGRPLIETSLPATAIGAEAIRIFITDHEGPAAIAAGIALMDLALAWGRDTLATTTLVSSGPASHAFGLARYARHAT